MTEPSTVTTECSRTNATRMKRVRKVPTTAMSSRPPPSTIRQNRLDRLPRRHSHHRAPDRTIPTKVIAVSGPCFTIPPPARPRTPPARLKKNRTFQNNASRVCRKARVPSLSSVGGNGFGRGIGDPGVTADPNSRPARSLPARSAFPATTGLRRYSSALSMCFSASGRSPKLARTSFRSTTVLTESGSSRGNRSTFQSFSDSSNSRFAA